jgi:murein DD-endopeptidase MepM/ murein hydrolase activator NlpD
MPDVRAIGRAIGAWRLSAVLAGGLVVAVSALLWSAEQRNTELRAELQFVQRRLADRRAMVGRQREEMAEVAAAVDRLARTVNVVRERETQARRLAHMEESREAESQQNIVPVKATVDGGMSIVGEDAARALAQLSWLDGQAADAGDSIAVLTVLLRTRREDGRRAVPTVWPVRGLITSAFGSRQSPWGEGTIERHAGIDISARYGMPVTASADGKVVFSGRDAGYGGLVIIDHGGELDTFYAHLSAIYVREGQRVYRGQPLGAVGATGRATGAHLHYEVRVRGIPVDPKRYLAN